MHEKKLTMVALRQVASAKNWGFSLILRHSLLNIWLIPPQITELLVKNLTDGLLLDVYDQRILSLLLEDGRMALSEIASQVHLSPTPVARRIKILEENGYISGYTAMVDFDALDMGIRAFLLVKREKLCDREKIWQELKLIPQILQAHVISGEYDLLLEVVSTNMNTYSLEVVDKLLAIPGVTSVNSLFALKVVKERDVASIVPALANEYKHIQKKRTRKAEL